MRKRKIMRYSGMDVIKLLPYDRTDLELEYGEEVDIDELIILKKKRSK